MARCAGRAVNVQVPFLKVANMGGKPVQNAVTAAAKPFASMLLGASGAQFFLHDSVDGQAPLLVTRHRLLLFYPAHTACSYNALDSHFKHIRISAAL